MSTPLEERIKAKLGPTAANTYAQIIADPEFKGMIIENLSPALDVEAALKQLKDVCDGKSPPRQSVSALRTLHGGLSRPLGLRGSANKPLTSGVKSEGLLPALRQCVAMKETHPVALSAMRVDKAGWELQIERIELLEGVYNTTQAFGRLVQGELNEERGSAATELREAVNEVRSLIMAHVPVDEHDRIRDYLYGAAQEGAQRTKENQATLRNLEEKARDEVTLATRRAAREDVARDMEAFAREIVKQTESQKKTP